MEDVNKTMEEFNARLTKVEQAVFGSQKRTKLKVASYKGLAGGVRLLMDNAFFDQPKAIEDIITELKREGYYNTYAGVASTLSTTFVKSQKVLTRIKQDGKWTYVKRK